MKKIFSLLITVCIYSTGVAQLLNTNLIVNGQPPAQLSEWGNRREVLMLIVSAPGAVGESFKLKTEIKLIDGTVIATTDLAKSPVFTPSRTGTTILVANDVMPLEYMVFTGKYKTSLERTGKMPADNYTICTQPVRPTDYGPMGEVKCKNFYLATTQLPILMKPYNEEVLDAKKAQTAIIFRWTPVVPRQTSPVTYRIQVFEVLPTQSPVQALRSNQPVLDKEILAATQYIWQPQMSFIIQDGNCEEKEYQDRKVGVSGDPGTGKYVDSNGRPIPDESGEAGNNNKISKCKYRLVWTIQTLDKDHNPVTRTDGNGEGRSEPIIFYVDSNKNKPSGNSSKEKKKIKGIKNDTGNGGG